MSPNGLKRLTPRAKNRTAGMCPPPPPLRRQGGPLETSGSHADRGGPATMQEQAPPYFLRLLTTSILAIFSPLLATPGHKICTTCLSPGPATWWLSLMPQGFLINLGHKAMRVWIPKPSQLKGTELFVQHRKLLCSNRGLLGHRGHRGFFCAAQEACAPTEAPLLGAP